MPTLFRWSAFLAFAVSFAATLHSAQAQGILDGPIGVGDVNAKQKEWLEKTIVKRRNYASEEQLRAQLTTCPEVGLDGFTDLQMRRSLVEADQAQFQGTCRLPTSADVGMETLQNLADKLQRPELCELPWQATAARQLSKDAATMLQNNAKNLHERLGRLPKNIKDDADLKPLRAKLWGETPDGKWDKPACVPAVTQILQAQVTPVRALLVEQLAKIPGSASSEALAQRAIYDLSPRVREQAVGALKSRPVSEYQTVLLSGLRWPWRPVTEHAAEAIATLQLKELKSQLDSLLQEPDPTLPFTRASDAVKGMYVKELVRISHTQNCLVCHPRSFAATDLVRGAVISPSPGEMFPSYASRKHFRGEVQLVQVRADNTTLRQDFSVLHRASPSDPPSQRFDYFVRERRATPKEVEHHQQRANGERPGGPNIQREAVLFALDAIGK